SIRSELTRREEKAWVMGQSLLYPAYHNKNRSLSTPVFEGWLGLPGLDGDGLGFDLFCLGECDGQDAVLELGFGFVCHNLRRQSNRAFECAPALLTDVIRLLFGFVLLFDLA